MDVNGSRNSWPGCELGLGTTNDYPDKGNPHQEEKMERFRYLSPEWAQEAF